MELRKRAFFDQEATVAELETGSFRDKSKHINGLFEIYEDEQKGQKWGKKALKNGGKKNFHFGYFPLPNIQKVGHLRKRDWQKKIDSG